MAERDELIAALVEALDTIRHQWAGHSEQCETVLRQSDKRCNCDWPKVAAQCDDALAKARGETQ